MVKFCFLFCLFILLFVVIAACHVRITASQRVVGGLPSSLSSTDESQRVVSKAPVHALPSQGDSSLEDDEMDADVPAAQAIDDPDLRLMPTLPEDAPDLFPSASSSSSSPSSYPSTRVAARTRSSSQQEWTAKKLPRKSPAAPVAAKKPAPPAKKPAPPTKSKVDPEGLPVWARWGNGYWYHGQAAVAVASEPKDESSSYRRRSSTTLKK